MTLLLQQLELQAANAYEFGSPGYERELRKLKVFACRELQNVPYCSDCRAFMDCELVKQFLRDSQGGSDGSGKPTT